MLNKNMVITGGSSGIGLATMAYFIKAGYRVHNLDITPSERTDNTVFYQCDVTVHAEVEKALSLVVSGLPGNQTIDVAIANAGKHMSANIENTSEEALLALFNLNVKGAYSLTQAVLPIMKENNNGVILYMGSDQSTIAKPNSFAYNLTKHALASIAKTTAIDYAPFNIRANVLCPGTIDTPLYQAAITRYCEHSNSDVNEVHAQEASQQPLNRIGRANEVAALALFLASDDAAFITGSLYAVDGGYTAA